MIIKSPQWHTELGYASLTPHGAVREVATSKVSLDTLHITTFPSLSIITPHASAGCSKLLLWPLMPQRRISGLIDGQHRVRSLVLVVEEREINCRGYRRLHMEHPKKDWLSFKVPSTQTNL